MLLMMITAMMAQAASQPQIMPTLEPSGDILVIAERMRRVRVVTRHDRKTGVRRCIVRRSSGIDPLDGAVCGATLACAQTETKLEGMLTCMRLRMPMIAQRFAKPATPGKN